MELTYPYLFVFCFLTVAGLFFSLPFFKYVDQKTPPNSSHNIPLDSLRYFLASFVFIAHSIGIYDHVLHGTFRGKYLEIDLLARSGVALFFAITGLLFWDKLKKKEVNWPKLYINRFFRIVPLIWFNTILIGVILFSISKEAPNQNYFKWFDFINDKKPDFTEFKNAWIFTAGVFWTLVYEWGFYFTLPALSMFSKRPLVASITISFALIYVGNFFFPKMHLHYLMFFVIGILASDISELVKLKKTHLDIILLTSIVTLLYFMPYPNDISSFSNVLFLSIMICINKKADLFGFLSIKGFQRLGLSSYSIYVMHGVILYCIIKYSFKHEFLIGNETYIFLLGYAIVLLFSTLTYKFIEDKFIEIGRMVKI